jgi:class 3 adenylate cyclase
MLWPGLALLAGAALLGLLLIYPAFDVERLPPLELKGKDEPVEAFVLHSLPAGPWGPWPV